MSIIYSLQLNQWQEHQFPDNLPSASDKLSVGGEFVISRTTTGGVVSRYKDDSWDMKGYDAQGICIYEFAKWTDGSDNPLITVIIGEMKRIQLARLYLYHRPRKPGTIRLDSLRKLARLALNNNLSLSLLFERKNIIRILLPNFSNLERNPMRDMLKLLKELFDFQAKHPEFKLAPTEYSIIQRMQSIYDKHPKAYNHDSQQTKLIPPRIYAALITALNSEIESFNYHGDALVVLFQQRKENPRFGLNKSRASTDKYNVSWSEAVSQLGLHALFESNSIADWKILRRYINEIKILAKYWIHLFSGMRDNEARNLPANAYKKISVAGAEISILRGYTSKIAGQNQTETFWITTPAAEKAVIAARYVGKISMLLGNFDATNLSEYPLFPAQGRQGDYYRAFKGAPVMPRHNMQNRQKRLSTRWPDLIVQEEDIRDLERFDGFRNWRNDPNVKVGQPWPLATHQCRRSLAVYAARSGMVSVGSLGLQFKHLSEVMTSYYRRGSAFALNFLQTEEAQGWLEELEHERIKSKYIDYESNVINSTSRLWGGEGNRIQVARDKYQPLIITTDREITEKKFLKGEMTYKMGPIGGCTNLELCDKISFTSIFACLDCEKSILDDDRSLKNIKRGLDNLKREQSLFVEENPQYKQLESEISAIYNKLEKTSLLEKMEEIA